MVDEVGQLVLNDSCWNFTQQNYSVFEIPVDPHGLTVPLYGYAMPVLVIVTTAANTIIVAVLWQKHMRTPSNVVLLAMALCDMFTVLFPSPLFFYMYALGNYNQPVSPPLLCYLWTYFHDYIPTIFHTASLWLTVALAAQRYIYVCHAPVARVWCTLSRVIKTIFFVLMFATLHQIVSFFSIVYEEGMCIWKEGDPLRPVCIAKLSYFFGVIQDVYYPVYFMFRVIFVHLGPCVMLVILNSLLFRALRKAQRKRERLLKENKKKECNKLRDSNCTTLMLIIVSTVVLVTELPLAIITILHILTSLEVFRILSPEDYEGSVMTFFVFSNSFIIFTYPINFPIYFGMSRQFRRTLQDMFHKRPKSKRFASSMISQRTSTQDTIL